VAHTLVRTQAERATRGDHFRVPNFRFWPICADSTARQLLVGVDTSEFPQLTSSCPSPVVARTCVRNLILIGLAIAVMVSVAE